MLKKLGSVIAIILIGCLVWVIFNIETISKKYIFPTEYSGYVEAAAYETGVDKYLIYAVIRTESGFNEKAVSDVGARGLMQYNIEYGSYLIKLLYEEYNDAGTAAAAYHSGRGTVSEWLKDPDYSSDGKTLDDMPEGKTKHYVKKVMTAYEGYTNLYKDDE